MCSLSSFDVDYFTWEVRKKGERGGNIYDAEFLSSYAVTHTGAMYNLTQVEHNDPAKIDSSWNWNKNKQICQIFPIINSFCKMIL